MKKFLTLRNAVLCCAAVLVLAALIMSFFVSLNATVGGMQASYKHILWGCDILVENGKPINISELNTYIGKTIKPMILPLIGLIMMVVATIGAILIALLVKKPFAKYIVAGLGLVILASGIMQFWPIESFAYANVTSTKGIQQDQVKDLVEYYIKLYKLLDASVPLAIVMGVLGCLSGVAVAASQFLPEKK